MRGLGHNNPPSSIDDVMAPFGDVIAEAENWADGTPVDNDAQMKAVDSLIAGIKAAEKAAMEGKEAEYRPHKAAGDEVIARWKPTLDDLAMRRKALLAMVDAYKRKRAAEADAERRAKDAAAREAMRAAEEYARQADAANIAAQREVEELRIAAIKAQNAAKDVDHIKGLRLTWFHEVTNTSALLRWINANDRAALDAFCEEYARTHRTDGIARDGMRAWQERVAA